MNMREKAQVMNDEEIRRALIRISHEILEKNHQHLENLVLVGIKSRGDTLAYRIAENLDRIENISVPVGAMDVTLYRDDINLHESQIKVSSTDIPFEVTGKWLSLWMKYYSQEELFVLLWMLLWILVVRQQFN